MITVELSPDGVGRVNPVVPRIGDRRDPSSKQKPFPKVPGEASEEEETDVPEPEDRPRPKRRAEDEDPTIDLLVLGRVLPTRQELPPRTQSQVAQELTA